MTDENMECGNDDDKDEDDEDEDKDDDKDVAILAQVYIFTRSEARLQCSRY